MTRRLNWIARSFWMMAAGTMIAACGVKPDGSNGVHRKFTVPGIGYKVAYERAVDYARTCHTSGIFSKGFEVNSEVFDDQKRAVVHITSDSTVIEDIKVMDATGGAAVDVVSIGRGYWSTSQLDRVQQSIQSGVNVCK